MYSSTDGAWKMLSTDQWHVVEEERGDAGTLELSSSSPDHKDAVKGYSRLIFFSIQNRLTKLFSHYIYSLIRRCIQDEKYLEMADFEDHLVDRTLDWLPDRERIAGKITN